MIKEYERELNELKESKLISKEDLHEGDEIIYNGEHYFVTCTDTGTDFVWITDDESDRYNRNAQGWTIKADWIDEVIGQPEEDELEESLKENYKKRYKKAPVMEDLDFADEAEIRKQLAKYSGQYLTLTFKGSYAWRHVSDLLEEYNDGDEEESDSALDELESTYRREYDLLNSLGVEEISEIANYTSYVVVTIKVDKDNLLHNFSDNYSDLINTPSIDKDTIKILELDESKNESLIKEAYQDVDSMSREELMGEIDGIYTDALRGNHIDITSIIEDPEVFNSDDSDDEEGYFKGVPTNKLRGILKILRKMKDGGSLTHDDVNFMVSKEVDLHESVESKEIIKEDVNMSRKEMIDWIEDHWNDTVEHGKWLYNYLTELGFNVEDDSDEEEGFYANLTTSDLRKVINELNPNTEVSVKERITGIRKALETLGKVSDVSLDYAGAEEATFDVDFKDGNTFRIQIYKM